MYAQATQSKMCFEINWRETPIQINRTHLINAREITYPEISCISAKMYLQTMWTRSCSARPLHTGHVSRFIVSDIRSNQVANRISQEKDEIWKYKVNPKIVFFWQEKVQDRKVQMALCTHLNHFSTIKHSHLGKSKKMKSEEVAKRH